MNRLRQYWRNLAASFWFVPSAIVLLSIVLAMVLIQADSSWNEKWLARFPRIFGAGAAGARGMLSTIAGSMMSVVGVTFSMTLVALALASSQYTSRILRNFMRDRVTQIVLGVFAGIFTYCLIVLRTIRDGDQGGFIPSLSVSFGVVLAVGGISVLLVFIHHISNSIQASNIIASVAEETLTAIDRLFPERVGNDPPDETQEGLAGAAANRMWQTIAADRSGYIQNVDDAGLLRLARKHQTVIRMEKGIGSFVVRGAALASVALDAPPDNDLSAGILENYDINRHRTVQQDAAFGIRQIVDMALRALSPGINDTTTAVTCVDYLTAILARLASRTIPSSHRHKDGELRVITIAPTFAGMVGESFDQIRANAGGNLAIMLRMLAAIQTIGTMTAAPGRRHVLHEHATWIAELAARTLPSPRDLEQFAAGLARAHESLEIEPSLFPQTTEKNL